MKYISVKSWGLLATFVGVSFFNMHTAYSQSATDWPADVSGVAPDAALGLSFNNIGVLNNSDQTIYSCLRILTNGAPDSVNGLSQVEVGFAMLPSAIPTLQLVKSRSFNDSAMLAADGQPPSCSGSFETTTGVYSDHLQVGNQVWQGSFGRASADGLDFQLQKATFVGGEGPSAPDGLTLSSPFAPVADMAIKTSGIFAVWWDPKFDHAADADFILKELNAVRADTIYNYGMQDPPNPAQGFYYNVYIHHNGEDIHFPSQNWALGQGTNVEGRPFLTLPNGGHLDVTNLRHEGFHVFQYLANSNGFAYAGDSGWYIESSAQWYAAVSTTQTNISFLEAGTIPANPHLALWHREGREAPGDTNDWMYLTRQYGLHTLLYYLSNYANVEGLTLTKGFYANTELSPQEYLYTNIGPDNFRKFFADWAARNTGGMDYLTQDQLDRAAQEVQIAGDPTNAKPHVIELSSATAVGTHSPPQKYRPRSWSYNAIKIANNQTGTYSFNLQGDATGSEGATSNLESRIVIKGVNGTRYLDVTMADATSGSATVQVDATDNEVFLVIAAVPAHFSGNQTYDYTVTIGFE